MNRIEKQISSNPDEFPLEKAIAMLKNAIASKADGVLLIISNGVEDVNVVSNNVETMVVLKDPETVALALFNQAVRVNDFTWIKEVCTHLHRIADCAQENIDDELNHLKNKN